MPIECADLFHRTVRGAGPSILPGLADSAKSQFDIRYRRQIDARLDVH
jgi:hypothetical protein